MSKQNKIIKALTKTVRGSENRKYKILNINKKTNAGSENIYIEFIHVFFLCAEDFDALHSCQFAYIRLKVTEHSFN